MATVWPPLPDLALEQLTLFHAVDAALASVFVFYGPAATPNASVSSSRIQAHIFSAAGVKSYPRLTVSPAAPLYAAVNLLPRDKQGDEVCRGLAFSIFRYLSELPPAVKDCVAEMAKTAKPSGRPLQLFDDAHAADLANRMTPVANSTGIVRDLRDAFGERKLPWVDVDVVLPPGTIADAAAQEQQQRSSADEAVTDDATPDLSYGAYSSLIRTLGDPVFLPTSRLRRAPSQPSNLSKSRIFTKAQKESLRLAMCELVDTEERYVSKIYDLVHNVVEEFRQKARAKSATSTSPDEAALADLFPPCLNEILEVNMGFLEAIRNVLESTEQTALADIAEDTEIQRSKQAKDPIGAVAFANTLMEWFPRFSQPYAQYMRAHTGFTQTLNTFLKDEKSSFSRRVQETGEQKLRSLLMEPVQRLPRYSLLIDTMTSQIPSVHPSVRLFLKARDTIKDICSLDNPANADNELSLRRVMRLVEYWPSSVVPAGRLITAVDAMELLPPYRAERQDPMSNAPSLVLLYKNYLVLLSRLPGSNMTARSLLSDLDAQAVGTTTKTLSQGNPHFRFVTAFDLESLRCMQSASGHVLHLIPSTRSSGPSQSNQTTSCALQLFGAYEGRANRLIEEIVKAKIEGRFTEREREGGKWTLRSPAVPSGDLGILAPVFEDDSDGNMGRAGHSAIRIVFDTPRAVSRKILESTAVEVIMSISSMGDSQYKIEMDSITGASAVDTISAHEFPTILSKTLCNLLAPLHQPQNPGLAVSLVNINLDVIRHVAARILSPVKSTRGFRPPSPSKLISNLWGGTSKDPPSLSKAFSANAVLGEIPKITPSKIDARPTTSPATFDDPSLKISIVGSESSQQDDPLHGLEQTFSSYMLALRSRSGNIVGRILHGRANADKSAVNALYNVLLEDPSRLQAAAEVPVDVLFVAFETFMLNAWKSSIGPIFTPETLQALQEKFDSLFPGDFEVYFRKILADLSPQNRRALADMIRLLADLLDASGNDGDRGALTVAFAEILAENQDPLAYISLLDRLVEDFDNLFEDFDNKSQATTPSRPVSSQTGSLSSNASSFRKRLGFGLHRENSTRSDVESKVGSLIRTLSKSKSSGDAETPKATLTRSKSTDTDSRLLDLLRPASRERPGLHGAFSPGDSLHRPGSSQDDGAIFDETSSAVKAGPGRRKKRRSSLSDLPRPSTPTEPEEEEELEPVEIPKPLTPLAGRSRPRSDLLVTRHLRQRSTPEPAQPSTSPARPASPLRQSPTRQPDSLLRPGSPLRNENMPPRPTLTERAINRRPQSPPATRKKRSDTLTSLPQPIKLEPTVERPMTSHGFESTRRERAWSSPQKPQKLRMQSPQKLRDRLQNERQAQIAMESTFQEELRLIEKEISAISSPQSTATDQEISRPTEIAMELERRVREMETKLATMRYEMETRTKSLENDIETSLLVSERRAKKLDELYRAASAENEALYERFNTELAKLVKDIRAGDGAEALKTQLREALEEVGRVKKENMRLKREVSGLRVQRIEGS